jgi:kynurenine formamidase
MFRNIFCGCTSNKNISREVFILNVEDIVDKEQQNEENKVEEGHDPALIEKNAKLNIETSVDAPSVDAPKVDAPQADAPQADAPSVDAPSSEEDQEIIDILTEKPIENNMDSKPITRKYLFF